MFCGLRRDKTFHGERSTTLDRKKEQHVGARAQVTYEFSHGPNPKILLGPVVGTVTSTTAIVLLEIDRAGPITCSIMNVTTSERRMVTRFCPKERPRSFFIQDLKPGTRYAIRFDGVSNSVDRRGGFTTLSEESPGLRFLAGSTDSPSLTFKDRMTTWESIWKHQIAKKWAGADGMIRLGGQVNLRVLSKDLDALLESYHDDFERLHEYRLATRDGTKLYRRDTDENRSCVSLARGPLWNSADDGTRNVNERNACSHSMRLFKT